MFVLTPENAAQFGRWPWSIIVCVTEFAVVRDFSFGMLFRSVSVDLI
jgi:hypothetical protein